MVAIALPFTVSAAPKDAFDLMADELIRAKLEADKTGRKLYKADLSSIMRTFYQAWQVAHPPAPTPIVRQKRASVARNPLFDALASLTGSDPAGLTKTAARTVAVALAEIREVCPNLTVDEINYRVKRYKDLHPQWPLTAMAICKNWSEIGGGYRTKSGKDNIYVEPNGWRPFAAKIHPNLAQQEWRDICVGYGAQILAAMP